MVIDILVDVELVKFTVRSELLIHLCIVSPVSLVCRGLTKSYSNVPVV